MKIEKKLCAEKLTAMIDCSRGAAPKISTIKKMIDYLFILKYDSMMLYTEDMYEMNDEPFFGYMRGKYSFSEFKEIIKYAKEKNITVIPCIQTLSHMDRILQWTKYSDMADIKDTILVEYDKTYVFIEKIIKTISEIFETDEINIGMDETFNLGLGRYIEKNSYKDASILYLNHLEKVCGICKKYNLKPMIWSDVILKYNYTDIKNIPSLIFWRYTYNQKENYNELLKKQKNLNKDLYYAGGSWRWLGFAPDNTYSINVADKILEKCKEENVNKIIVCLWGDNGGEGSMFASLPTLTAYSIMCGRIQKDYDEAIFDVCGVESKVFESIDRLNRINPNMNINEIGNMQKLLFYSDIFLDFTLSGLRKGMSEEYKKIYKTIDSYQKCELSLLLNSYAKLAKCLSVKSYIIDNVREFYKSDNKKGLIQIVKLCGILYKYIEEFYKIYLELWNSENKSFGFEIEDTRIGGLLLRTKHIEEILKNYIKGDSSNIPELEEELLDYYGQNKQERDDVMVLPWGDIVTPSVI